MTVGKNPSMFENLNIILGYLSFRFCVALFSSNAMINPVMVTVRAASFK